MSKPGSVLTAGRGGNEQSGLEEPAVQAGDSVHLTGYAQDRRRRSWRASQRWEVWKDPEQKVGFQLGFEGRQEADTEGEYVRRLY